MLMLYLAMIEEEADQATFEQLYYAHSKEMLKLAYSVLNNYADAEDAVQNAFINLSMSLPCVPTEINARRAYVLAVTRNAALRYKRKNAFWEKREDIDKIEPSIREDTFEAVVRLRDLQLLRRITLRLPLQLREVLMLRYVSNMSPREIAKLLCRKPDTVRKQLLRGKQLLIACYKEEVSDE